MDLTVGTWINQGIRKSKGYVDVQGNIGLNDVGICHGGHWACKVGMWMVAVMEHEEAWLASEGQGKAGDQGTRGDGIPIEPYPYFVGWSLTHTSTRARHDRVR